MSQFHDVAAVRNLVSLAAAAGKAVTGPLVSCYKSSGLRSQPQNSDPAAQKAPSPMIRFSLGITVESTITINNLRAQALSAVIDELADCGYTINPADIAAPLINLGEANYPLEPGPATLAMIIQGESSGNIAFRLDGPRFGMAGRRPENDAVLWMRLWTLGHRLANAHKLIPNITDPDFETPNPSRATMSH